MAKILIADDDVILKEMYEARLKASGYTVVSATDGAETYEKVEKEKPDIILLDVMMPKMNGIDVMKKIRANPDIAHIPIILLTALVREIDKIKDMMKPGDDYLIKSEIMPGDVVKKIEQSLGEAVEAAK
jgi:CheY-like chemotaxis protein